MPKTPQNSVIAALSADSANFVRIAPCTYALRASLHGCAATGAAPGAGAGAPYSAADAASTPAVDVAEHDALGALSLNELRAAFEAVCGRKTTSKNKDWLRRRLQERGYYAGGDVAALPSDGAENESASANAKPDAPQAQDEASKEGDDAEEECECGRAGVAAGVAFAAAA